MTKGLGFGRSLRGTPGDSRMFAGLRGARLRPARLKRAEERRNDIRTETIVPPLRRIPHSDCFTTPAAGNRRGTTGALADVGVSGSYWSSSPFSASVCVASALWLYPSEVRPTDSGTLAFRSVAVPVRCVQASTRKLPGEGADVAAKNAETHPDPRAAPCAGEEKDLEIRIILSTFVHSATTGFWPSGPGFLFFYVYTEAGNPARKNSSEERRL